MPQINSISKNCGHISPISICVKIGIVTAIALGAIATIGYFAFHWPRMTVAILGGTGSVIGIASVLGAIRSVKGSLTSASSSKQTASRSTISSSASVNTSLPSEADIAIEIYESIVRRDTTKFKELLAQHKTNLHSIFEKPITDTAHLYNDQSQSTYRLPLCYVFQRMRDWQFLSIVIESTKGVRSFDVTRRTLQAYELYKLMKNEHFDDFKLKLDVYERELSPILDTLVFLEERDPIHQKLLDVRQSDSDQNIFSTHDTLQTVHAEYLFDIAVALASQDNRLYLHAFKNKLQRNSFSSCSEQALLQLLPGTQIEEICELLTEDFKESLMEEAIKVGKVAWFKTLYLNLNSPLHWKHVYAIRASKVDFQTKLQFIEAIPSEQLLSYRNNQETIIHQILSYLKTQDEMDQFHIFCNQRLASLLEVPDSKGNVPQFTLS